MKNIEKTGSKNSEKMEIGDISDTVNSKSMENIPDGTMEFMVQSLRRLDTQIHALNKLCRRRVFGLERERGKRDKGEEGDKGKRDKGEEGDGFATGECPVCLYDKNVRKHNVAKRRKQEQRTDERQYAKRHVH